MIERLRYRGVRRAAERALNDIAPQVPTYTVSNLTATGSRMTAPGYLINFHEEYNGGVPILVHHDSNGKNPHIRTTILKFCTFHKFSSKESGKYALDFLFVSLVDKPRVQEISKYHSSHFAQFVQWSLIG